MSMPTSTPLSISELLDRLGAEHGELLPRIRKLARIADSDGAELTEEIDALAGLLSEPLEGHIAAEDDILFPAFARATNDRGVVSRFSEEHREILTLRDRLLAARRAGEARSTLRETVLQLGDLLTSHMSREELILFPIARELLT